MAHPFDTRRFLVWTATAIGLGVAACTALVAVVDPYRLYRLVERPGFNLVKTQPTRYQPQIKLSGAKATGAQLLIVGNSRAEIGLDPADPALAATALPAYNLALAGTRIDVANGQLAALAQRGQRPRHLIVGAEFLDFPINPTLVQAPEKASPQESVLSRLSWQFDTLFSIDSVADSVKTITQQKAPYAKIMTAQGFNPLNDYLKMAQDEGYYALFQQRATDYAKRFHRVPRGLLPANSSSAREFEQFGAVVEQGVRDGARVDVVIYPYHVQLMALYESADMMSMFDEWKRLLAIQLEQLRQQHPQARITLWDFSGYGAYQCEAIPARGDRKSKTAWYWEAGHFKATLGHQMLQRMLSGAPDAQEPGFGFVLTPATLAQNRVRIAQERAVCAAQQPTLFSDTATLYEKQGVQ